MLNKRCRQLMKLELRRRYLLLLLLEWRMGLGLRILRLLKLKCWVLL